MQVEREKIDPWTLKLIELLEDTPHSICPLCGINRLVTKINNGTHEYEDFIELFFMACCEYPVLYIYSYSILPKLYLNQMIRKAHERKV